MPEQSNVTITFHDENGEPHKPIEMVLPYRVDHGTLVKYTFEYHAWLNDSELIDLTMETNDE